MPPVVTYAKPAIAFFIVISCLWKQCSGQHAGGTPATVEIETKEGMLLKGKLMGNVNDTIRLLDEAGTEWKIPFEGVRNIDQIDSMRTERWFSSPNTIRYLLASTALPLRKKEIAFQTTYLFLVSAHYGITRRLSVGAGADIISNQTHFFNTKFSVINNAGYKFSVGLNYYRLPDGFLSVGTRKIRGLGIIQANSTWGSKNHHLTLGTGYVYAAAPFIPLLVTLSGTTRVVRNFAIVTENWFFYENASADLPALFSLGVRYISKNSSLDFAFYSDRAFSFETGLPYIGYTFKINND